MYDEAKLYKLSCNVGNYNLLSLLLLCAAAAADGGIAVIFNYMRDNIHMAVLFRIFFVVVVVIVLFCMRIKLEKIFFRFKKCALNRSLTHSVFPFLFHSFWLARFYAFVRLRFES